jgi:hypothetical protein
VILAGVPFVYFTDLIDKEALSIWKVAIFSFISGLAIVGIADPSSVIDYNWSYGPTLAMAPFLRYCIISLLVLLTTTWLWTIVRIERKAPVSLKKWSRIYPIFKRINIPPRNMRGILPSSSAIC